MVDLCQNVNGELCLSNILTVCYETVDDMITIKCLIMFPTDFSWHFGHKMQSYVSWDIYVYTYVAGVVNDPQW